MSLKVDVRFTQKQALLVQELLRTATDEQDEEHVVEGAARAVARSLERYGCGGTYRTKEDA